MPEDQVSGSAEAPVLAPVDRGARAVNARTILVVEDDLDMIDVVSLILADGGYDVLQATSGEEALSTLRESRPDLIVSDIMMVGMDGLALYKEVRADPDMAHIPFIFLTAMAQRTDVRRGMELGADDYITKPFEPEELLSAVRTRLIKADEARVAADRASAELKRTIIQTATHELQTPLTLMLGYTELLEAMGPEPRPEDLQEILRGLYTGTRRLMGLVKDMLLLSRLESGDLLREVREAPPQAAKPDRVLRDVAVQFEPRAAESNVSLVWRVGASAKGVAIQETHLAEIVRRLVDNALKFSRKEGAEVVVATGQDGRNWRLEVADNGVGIDPKALPWVFEAFRQVDRDKMEQQGAGLGLAIVRGLTEAYGGAVTVESTLGQGARFTVHLPLAP